MLWKAIAFAIIFYLLIKVVSRAFLPSNKKNSKARIFYEVFKNVQQQKKNHRQSSSSGSDNNFEEIEEAEYEDVTDEDKTSTTSSD